MKKLLLLALFLSTSAFSLNLQCEIYGVNCPRPCDKFEQTFPGKKSINDGALCIVRKKDFSLIAKHMQFMTPMVNSDSLFIELKNGAKLMAVNMRTFHRVESEKKSEMAARGVNWKMLTPPQLTHQYSKSWTDVGKNFLDALKKTFKSDEIGKDDCELIEDVIDRELKDSHSDEAREKIKQETCKDWHEKRERNDKDIKEIKDRI